MADLVNAKATLTDQKLGAKIATAQKLSAKANFPDRVTTGAGDLQTEINSATPAELSDALEANLEGLKIAYRRPALTGQVTSYRTGDDAWRLMNGVYEYDKQGKRPLYQGEDPDNADGTLADWFKLSPKTPNAFNNLFVYTDSNGDHFLDSDADGIPDAKNIATAYDDDYIINHITGQAVTMEALGNANWGGSMDGAVAYTHSILSFSDFYALNVNEVLTFFNYEFSTVLGWEPFGITGTNDYHLGTTIQNETSRAYIGRLASTRSNGQIGQTAKIVSRQQLYIRNHFN